MMTDQAHDADLDALAFTLATLRGDYEARTAVALHCDPPELLDSLVALLVASIAMNVGASRVEAVLEVWQAGAAASGGDK